MADLKISELPSLTGSLLANNDVVVIVDTNNTATKKLAISDLFGYIPVTANVAGNLIVAGSTSVSKNIRIVGATSVTSNNATTVFGANPSGTLAWDANYLYLATSNTNAQGTLKRVALSDFT